MQHLLSDIMAQYLPVALEAFKKINIDVDKLTSDEFDFTENYFLMTDEKIGFESTDYFNQREKEKRDFLKDMSEDFESMSYEEIADEIVDNYPATILAEFKIGKNKYVIYNEMPPSSEELAHQLEVDARKKKFKTLINDL